MPATAPPRGTDDRGNLRRRGDARAGAASRLKRGPASPATHRRGSRRRPFSRPRGWRERRTDAAPPRDASRRELGERLLASRAGERVGGMRSNPQRSAPDPARTHERGGDDLLHEASTAARRTGRGTGMFSVKPSPGPEPEGSQRPGPGTAALVDEATSRVAPFAEDRGLPLPAGNIPVRGIRTRSDAQLGDRGRRRDGEVVEQAEPHREGHSAWWLPGRMAAEAARASPASSPSVIAKDPARRAARPRRGCTTARSGSIMCAPAAGAQPRTVATWASSWNERQPTHPSSRPEPATGGPARAVASRVSAARHDRAFGGVTGATAEHARVVLRQAGGEVRASAAPRRLSGAWFHGQDYGAGAEEAKVMR